MRRPESSILLLMILMAIILAIGIFLAISILLDRPAAGEATTAVSQELPPPNTVSVEGETVTLQIDPAQRPQIIIVPTATPPPAVQETAPETATAAPTAVPAQPEVQGGEGGQPQPAGGQPANHLTFINYQVQAGDNLFRIQEKHITSIALMAKHGISSWDIVVGNVLNLPVGNSASCGDWQAYVVIKGDTAFGISRRHGIALEELRLRNNLDANYSIYETQVICVP